MKNPFSEVTTKAELKAIYRSLAKKMHPDTGGCEDSFKELQELYANAQYSVTVNDAISGMNSRREQQANGAEYETVTIDNLEVSAEVLEALRLLLKCVYVKIDVSLIGTWIWVKNVKFEDKEIRATLRELNYKYNRKKQAWYFTVDTFKSRGRGNATFEEIERKYGHTKVVKGDAKKALSKGKSKKLAA